MREARGAAVDEKDKNIDGGGLYPIEGIRGRQCKEK